MTTVSVLDECFSFLHLMYCIGEVMQQIPETYTCSTPDTLIETEERQNKNHSLSEKKYTVYLGVKYETMHSHRSAVSAIREMDLEPRGMRARLTD